MHGKHHIVCSVQSTADLESCAIIAATVTKYVRMQTYMANINKARTKTLTDRHSYLRSLNRFLENMPEHCMEDLDTVLPGQIFGSIAVLLSVASGYIALTSTVLSMKKDY